FNIELPRPNLIGGTPRPLAPGEWLPAAPPAEQPRQSLEYWQVMRANLGWICLVAALGGCLGWLVAALKPAMYQAHTVLDIRSLNQDFLNPRDGSPISNSDS